MMGVWEHILGVIITTLAAGLLGGFFALFWWMFRKWLQRSEKHIQLLEEKFESFRVEIRGDIAKAFDRVNKVCDMLVKHIQENGGRK